MEYSRGTERERIYRTLSALPIDFKPLSGANPLLRVFVKESKRCSITTYYNTICYNTNILVFFCLLAYLFILFRPPEMKPNEMI